MNEKIQSFVKVATLPGKVETVTFEGHEISVAEAIRLAGKTVPSGYEVRTDKVVTDLKGTMVSDRGVITIAQKVSNG